MPSDRAFVCCYQFLFEWFSHTIGKLRIHSCRRFWRKSEIFQRKSRDFSAQSNVFYDADSFIEIIAFNPRDDSRGCTRQYYLDQQRKTQRERRFKYCWSSLLIVHYCGAHNELFAGFNINIFEEFCAGCASTSAKMNKK